MADIIQIRRGTAANWTTANPVLADGEFGYEKDTKRLKMGDAITPWTSLPYLTNSNGIPPGGATNQILKKVDGSDYNVIWADLETFTATANQYGTHPAFSSQNEAIIWLLGNSGGTNPVTLNALDPISATIEGADSININWTDTNS